MSHAATFRIYSRAGCHLCDEMIRELESLRNTTPEIFTVEIVDIDREPGIQHLYRLRIPVLTVAASGKILCESRLQRQSVLDYLATARQQDIAI